jgi:hypothetical protein
MLKKGDPRAFKVIADRAYGPPTQQIDSVEHNTMSVQIEMVNERAPSAMSDVELRERIAQLQQELSRRSAFTREHEQVLPHLISGSTLIHCEQ